MQNVKKITWLSYFLFTILGMFYISQGVLIIQIAPSYGISLAHLGYLLFIPAVIQAAGIYINGYLLEKVNLKKEIIIGLAAAALSIVCTVSGILPVLILGLVALGIGYTLLCSVPNYLVITLHPDNKFSKLNILNFFFSTGGIVGPFVVGQLLGINIDWRIIVLLSLVLLFAVYCFALKIPFSKINSYDDEIGDSEERREKKKWNFSVYLIAIAMLFYVLSEVCFSSWIVAYLKMNYGYPIVKASLGLAVFWGFITFGRFAADKIGKYLKIYQFILLSSSLAFIAYLLLFLNSHVWFIFTMIAIMGIGYASLYASIFAYGMDQIEKSDPQLMSFFIICGTVGNILAMPMSSFFVQKFGILAALILGLIIVGAVVLCIYLTLYDKKNIALTQKKRRIWGAITKRTRILLFKGTGKLRRTMQE